MITTANVLANFEKFVKNYTRQDKISDLKKIETEIKKINSIPPPNNKSEAIRFFNQKDKFYKDLMRRYVIQLISQKYPVLDNQIFKLKRTLNVSWRRSLSYYGEVSIKDLRIDNDMAQMEELSSKKKSVVTKKTKDRTQSKINMDLFVKSFVGEQEKKISIKSGMFDISFILPRIPAQVMAKGMEAIANVYQVASKILSQDLGDFDLAQLFELEDLSKIELSVIWIPTEDSLKLRHVQKKIPKPTQKDSEFEHRVWRDPALILQLGENYNFLVTTYYIKDELPFESYLREFTTDENFSKKIS